MKKIYAIVLLLTVLSSAGQSFSGSTGAISDDGSANFYTTSVSGLSNVLNADYGLVKVCLNISHTYDSDLNVQLISPDGAATTLINGIGGSGHDFYGCLSQSVSNPVGQGTAPFPGTYKPQETLGNLNDGASGNGTWTLKIVDTYPFADTGTVNSWHIEFGADAATPNVFSSSNLPIVLLNTNGSEIPDEPSIPAAMKIIYNGEGQINHVSDPANNYDGNIGIELRGNYSQGLPQKPYKIETHDAAGEESNVSLLGMPPEHDWCLIANYNDKVFMRNTLAYKLFEEMGHYAPRSKYVEVVLNGSYQGVYMLMEKIKRDHNRVDIAKLETTENTGVNVTGGYIIKDDYWTWEDSWQLNYHPLDHPDLDVRLVYEYPKPEDITTQQQSYIQNFIINYETALYGDNFTDTSTGWNKYIDADSFIDYFIVNELARNIDGFRKSQYYYKDIDTPAATSKLNAGPVWDFDWAWKDIWSCSIFEATDGSGWAYKINDCAPDVNSTGWYVRLLQDPAFANRLRCRWDNFRTGILSEDAIDAYIDSTANYLSEAQQRHFDKWGNLGVNTGTPEVENDPATFPAQISQFRNWIYERLSWLDANIPGDASNCSLVAVSDAVSDGLTVYPNPASNVLYVKMKNNAKPESIELLDVSGKIVSVKNRSAEAIDVLGLAAGMYFCKVGFGGHFTTAKVSITR